MTQVIETIRRLRASQEAAGSFGTEISISNFNDIYAIEDGVKLSLNRPMESPGINQQHLDGTPSKVFLAKSAQLDFATNLSACTVRAPAGHHTPSTHVRDGDLWHVAMGGRVASDGVTVASASSSSVFTLNTGHGLAEGCCVALPTGTGGALEMRVVKTVSTNTITVKMALSSTPTSGMICYGTTSYFMDHLDGSTVKSLQMTYEGQSTLDKWLLRGGQLQSPPSLELNPGGIPKAKWSWMFAGYNKANGVDATMNLNTFGDQNLTDAGINAVVDSELRIVGAATTALTSTLVHAPQITVTPAMKYVAHKSPAGLNNIVGWVRDHTGPVVTVEFVVPYQDDTWFTRRDAETPLAFYYQIGMTVAGGGVLIDIPNCYVDDVQRDSVDNIAALRVTMYARLDAYTTTNSNTSAVQKSAMRLHFS